MSKYEEPPTNELVKIPVDECRELAHSVDERRFPTGHPQGEKGQAETKEIWNLITGRGGERPASG